MGRFLTDGWRLGIRGSAKIADPNADAAAALSPLLESWYDASAIAPGAITSITNKQGVGSALTGTATVVANQQNGLQGIVFNGTTDVMSGTLGTPAARTLSVALFAAVGINTGFALNLGASNNGILRRTAGQWVFTSPITSFGPVVPQPGVLTIVLNGATVDLYLNGALVLAGTTTADANGITAPIFLGAMAAASGFKACTIFESRTFGVALTPAQIAVDASYLRSKWGV